MVGGVDRGAALWHVFAAERAEAEVAAEERQKEEAHDAKDEAIYAVAASLFKQLLAFHTCLTNPGADGYTAFCTFRAMQIDLNRTLRGALAGAIATGIWALQQPIDMRIFGVPYDDTELLGKAVTRGPAWRPIGAVMHLANGALFGAVYANVAPHVPLPPALKGPAAGMAEHLASWPAVGLSERFHPARDELPKLSGSGAAFAQATWRHLLFGFVLGEAERALNRPSAE